MCVCVCVFASFFSRYCLFDKSIVYFLHLWKSMVCFVNVVVVVCVEFFNEIFQSMSFWTCQRDRRRNTNNNNNNKIIENIAMSGDNFNLFEQYQIQTSLKLLLSVKWNLWLYAFFFLPPRNVQCTMYMYCNVNDIIQTAAIGLHNDTIVAHKWLNRLLRTKKYISSIDVSIQKKILEKISISRTFHAITMSVLL